MCLRIHGCEIHVLCWEEDLLYEYAWLWDPFPMAAKKKKNDKEQFENHQTKRNM